MIQSVKNWRYSNAKENGRSRQLPMRARGPRKERGTGGWMPALMSLGWAMFARSSLARSHRQIGLFRGFGFCPFRERVHVPSAAGIPLRYASGTVSQAVGWL